MFILQTVTFQMFIVTDFVNTYTKFMYGDLQMKWDMQLTAGVKTIYDVRVGFAISPPLLSHRGGEYQYSYFDINTHSVTDIGKIQRLDEVVEQDTVQSGTTEPGKLYFALSANNASFVNHGKKCTDWITAATDAYTPPLNNECPCNHNLLIQVFSLMYEQVNDNPLPSGVTCYTSALFGNYLSVTPRCCYANNNLVRDATSLGGLNLYQASVGTQYEEDVSTFQSCCNSPGVASAMCDVYLFFRPPPACINDGFRSGKYEDMPPCNHYTLFAWLLHIWCELCCC